MSRQPRTPLVGNESAAMGVQVRSLRRISLFLFCLVTLAIGLISCDSDSSSDADLAAALAARNAGFTNNFGDGSGVGGPRLDDVKPGSGLPGSFSPNGPLGGFSGQVTRAADGSVVVGAIVTLLDGSGATVATATTDSNGVYGFGNIPAGNYTVRAEAPDLLTSERPITYSGGTVQIGTALSAPVPTGQFRAVLSWGERPIDLDAHLFLPADKQYHIYYSRKGSLTSCPNAALDYDDTSSFGPETTTISLVYPGDYQYAVYNYGGDSNFNESNAFVEVYDSTGRIGGFRPPAGESQRWWHVFSFNGGTVTPVNQLVNDFAPYPDSISGCSGP